MISFLLQLFGKEPLPFCQICGEERKIMPVMTFDSRSGRPAVDYYVVHCEGEPAWKGQWQHPVSRVSRVPRWADEDDMTHSGKDKESL